MVETGADSVEDVLTATFGKVAWQSAYRIEEDGDDFVIRIPTSMVSRDRLQRFLDSVEFEHLVSKSQLTAEDAAALAAEVKRAVWEKLRHHLSEAQ
jgi:hypothetical protein